MDLIYELARLAGRAAGKGGALAVKEAGWKSLWM